MGIYFRIRNSFTLWRIGRAPLHNEQCHVLRLHFVLSSHPIGKGKRYEKLLALTSFAALLALPAFSHAAPVCFTDNFDNFYRLEVKPACKANSSKISPLNGRVHFADPNVTCGGISNVFAITGTCFGRPSDNKVVVGLQFMAEGGDCKSQIMHLAGPTIATASGAARATNLLSSSAIFYTPADCTDEPTL